MVDFGCVTGAWLRAARESGVSDNPSLDGNWAQKEYIQDVQFRNIDLTERIELDRAISLEVAEHLPSERASSFIGDLVASCRYCLFGAAVPQQGGAGHINEQWQSYLAEMFRKHGFLPVDMIQPSV